jgi:hypothetical protein
MKRPSAPIIIASTALFFSLAGAGIAAQNNSPVTNLQFGKPAYAPPAGSLGIAIPAAAIATCPTGQHAISGGWNSSNTTGDIVSILSSESAHSDRAWLVVAKDNSRSDNAAGYAFQAVANCG